MINLGAFGLVRLMREGEVSAREVIAAHVARSEEVNPLINAIVVPRFADALAEAARLDHAFTHLTRSGQQGFLQTFLPSMAARRSGRWLATAPVAPPSMMH